MTDILNGDFAKRDFAKLGDWDFEKKGAEAPKPVAVADNAPIPATMNSRRVMPAAMLISPCTPVEEFADLKIEIYFMRGEYEGPGDALL
jgi:hypothetical protein